MSRGQAFLGFLLFLFKAHALNVHVHADNAQAGHGFNGLADVFLHFGRDLLDGLAVFDDRVNIDGRFFTADFHTHAACNIAVAADDIADTAAGAHPRDAVDLVGRDARDDRDDLVGIGNGAAVLQIHVNIDGQIILLGWHNGMHLLTDTISIANFSAFGNCLPRQRHGSREKQAAGKRTAPGRGRWFGFYGAMRLGPLKMNSVSLMDRPSSSMVSLSTPSPKPPCGGQP